MKKYIIIAFLCTHFCFTGDINKSTTYLGLCTEFWDFDKPVPSVQEYKFFRKYVANSSGPILEPMCGSGRYIIPLLEEGFNVEGFDASPFMFEAMRKKCAAKNLSPHIWEKYLEQFPETKQYNLIFIPDTSFCHFLTRADIKNALQKIYSLLLPKGIFVFDLQTIYEQLEHIGVWTGKVFRKNDTTTIVENRLILPRENSVVPVMLRYELVENGLLARTEMEYYRIKLFHPTEIDDLLKEVGFSKIKKIKAHQHGHAPSSHDDMIVYECTK